MYPSLAMALADDSASEHANLRLTLPQCLLAIALFIVPLIGGQVSIESQPLAPGIGRVIVSILEGTELPLFTHALIGILAVCALAITLIRNPVLQAPTVRFSIPFLAMFGLLGFTVTYSEFKTISASAFVEWCSYGALFYAIVAAGGRGQRLKLLAGSFVAGSSLLALKGISEYAATRASDPGWRIFANWQNPNALAGMLLLGLFVALGLMLGSSKVLRLIWCLCATVILFALILTQSKGGYLAAAFGLVVVAAFGVFWGVGRRLLPAAVPVAFALGLALLLNRSQANGGAFFRVTSASTTQEQSSGFRKLLWKSAIETIQREPKGVGLGVYRFSSAKPGLTQQTHMAHNTYLQLAAEGSAGVLGLFVITISLWVATISRGARRLPDDRNLLRLGILGGISASLAHSVVDSDLYYFGLGFAFFGLLGIGLQLAADGTGPEYVPFPLRATAALVALLLVAGGGIYFGNVELQKAQLRAALMARSQEHEDFAQILSLAPFDGEAWYLAGAYDPSLSQEERIHAFREAAANSPTPRHLRALSRAFVAAGQYETAYSVLDRVFVYDPNNLLALKQMVELDVAQSDLSALRNTLARIEEVEHRSAFTVLAIPEMVPTETYEARISAAKIVPNVKEKARLLQAAVKGFSKYAAVTLPRIKQMAALSAEASFGDETLSVAKQKIDLAHGAALELAKIYRSLGDVGAAEKASSAAAGFEVD